MLTATIAGLTFHRALVDEATPAVTQPLRESADYSFVVSYGAFTDSAYETVAKNAGIIDLTQGAEVAFSKFQSTCRKHIRRAERTPGLTFHSGIEDFDGFYAFYSTCERERDWFPVPPEEIRHSHVMYACYRGQPVAGVTCYSDGRRLRLGRIFSRRRADDWEEDSRLLFGIATRRMIFDYCLFGEKNRFALLDIGGVDLDSPEKAGITTFKMSFGIEVVPVIIGRHAGPRFREREAEIKALGYDLT